MKRSPVAPRAQAGFTLLEAVVAMVLIGVAGLALFAWINASLISLARVQDANARSEATVNILEYMHRVNPMLAPEGGASLGEYSFRWRASPVTPVVEGADHPRGLSLYQLAQFETAIAVSTAGGGAWFDLKLRQVGYRKVRQGSFIN